MRRDLYYNYIGYPNVYEGGGFGNFFRGIGSWVSRPFNKTARYNASVQSNPNSYGSGEITNFNTTGNGTTDWGSMGGFATGQTSQNNITNPYQGTTMMEQGFAQTGTPNGETVDNNAFANGKGESNGTKSGGGVPWGAIASAAGTNIANAFLDTEAPIADRVAGALGIPALANVWKADTTKGDAFLKNAQANLDAYKKNNYIQDASSTSGAANAVKLNTKQSIMPVMQLAPNLSWKDFRGNMFAKGAAATAQGAAAGSVGGPWGALGGATVGLLGSLFGGIGAKRRAKKAYEDFQQKWATIQSAQQAAYKQNMTNQSLSNMQALANGNMSQKINDMANIRAYGGNLFDDGGDLTDDDYVYEGGILPEVSIIEEAMPWYEKWYNKSKRAIGRGWDNVKKVMSTPTMTALPGQSPTFQGQFFPTMPSTVGDDLEYALSIVSAPWDMEGIGQSAWVLKHPKEAAELLKQPVDKLVEWAKRKTNKEYQSIANRANSAEDALELTKDRLRNGGFDRLESAYNSKAGKYNKWVDDPDGWVSDNSAINLEYGNRINNDNFDYKNIYSKMNDPKANWAVNVPYSNKRAYTNDDPLWINHNVRNNIDELHYPNELRQQLLDLDVIEIPSSLWGRGVTGENIGVASYGRTPVIFTDRPAKYANNSAKSQLAAHEYAHTVYYPDELPKDVFSPKSKYLKSANGAELNARGTQIKNYFGLKEREPLTAEHLKYAKNHMTKDLGYDNNMTEFFESIKDYKKAAKWLNEHSPAIGGITTGIGVLTNLDDEQNINAMGGNLYTDLSPNMMNLWNNKQQIDQQKANMQQMNFGLGNSFNQKFNTFDGGGWMDYITNLPFLPKKEETTEEQYNRYLSLINDERYKEYMPPTPFVYKSPLDAIQSGFNRWGREREKKFDAEIAENRRKNQEEKERLDKFNDVYHSDWGEYTPDFANMSYDEYKQKYNNPNDPDNFDFAPEAYNQYKYRLYQSHPNTTTHGNAYLFFPGDKALKEKYPEKGLPVYRDKNGNLYLRRGIKDQYGNNKVYEDYNDEEPTRDRRNAEGDLRITPNYKEWKKSQTLNVPHESFADFKKNTEEQLLHHLRYTAFENDFYSTVRKYEDKNQDVGKKVYFNKTPKKQGSTRRGFTYDVDNHSETTLQNSNGIPDDFMSRPIVEHDEIIVTPQNNTTPTRTARQRSYDKFTEDFGGKEGVRNFQEKYNQHHPESPIAVDGIAGPETVRAYQKWNNEYNSDKYGLDKLKEDGFYGDKSREYFTSGVGKRNLSYAYGGNLYKSGGYFGIYKDDDPPYEIANTTVIRNIPDTTVMQIDPYSQALLDGYTPSEYVDMNTQAQMEQERQNAKNMLNNTVNTKYGERFSEADYNNRYAGGGNLSQSDLPDNMQYYANGGTHEENPYGGIQVGTDQQGNPNLVEEGEFRWGDYIFSDRINVDPTLLSRYNLAPATKHQGKKANKGKLSYADMAKKYAKKNNELFNDPIGKNTLEAYMKRLQDAQEDQKFQDSMEQQKQDAINQYRNALSTPTQGNPMYAAMKYNGMGNAATQQGVNAGMSDLGQQSNGNEVLSNTNRSGNNMLHALGGNLYWGGSFLKKHLPPYGDPESRIDYAMSYTGNPIIPNGSSRIDYANQFLQGNQPVNDYGVSDFMNRIYSGNVGFGSPKVNTTVAQTQTPQNFQEWALWQHDNGNKPYIGSANTDVEPDAFALQAQGKTADGSTVDADYTTGYNGAINTNTGRSNLTDNIKRDTTTTFGTAAIKGDQKQVPHYSTAGEYAMFGKGLTPMIWDWMNKTNTKYDPNQRPAYELADMGNNSTFLRTADTIGGYRAPNLMDAERMNNAAQAQGIAALQAALNVGNGNRGFAAAQAAQNAYNTQMGIGNNYATAQQANNEERYKTDAYNTAIDQFNANARNTMYQDNQKAQQVGQNMAIDAKKAANDYILRNELYADATNRQAMENRAANQAAWTDNALNYFIAQAQKNDILNAKNNDITNPYWTDKDGVMHYIGDSGLNSAIYDAFTSGDNEWGNYAVNNGTFSGDRLKEWEKLQEKYSAADLKAHPELWKSLVLQEKQARKEEAEKAELAKTDRLNNQKYAFDNNMAQLNSYRTLYGDKFTDGQWYDDLMKRYNDAANKEEFNDVNNLEYWNKVIGDKLNYWQRYNTPVTAQQSAYGGYINNNNKSNKREYYNYMRR